MRPRKPVENAEPNLVPIMNLVTILIPFLLMASSFVALAVVDTALPSIFPEASAPSKDAQSITIFIDKDGYRVDVGQDAGLADTLDLEMACTRAECPAVADYDVAQLTRVLNGVKDARPDEDTLIIVPDSSVLYEVLIGTMDAARADGDRILFPYVVIAGGAQ